MKRGFDLLVALTGLVVLGPVLLITALALLLREGSPVLFRQERIGRGGRGFMLVKFRTMENRPGEDRNGFDPGARAPVTTCGRVLRRTKLDELPQLWNVIRGEMSLVGPRPEVRRWTEVYPERWAVVHSVRPGITDPASIAFRNEEELLAAAADPERTYRLEVLPRKLAMGEAYVRHHSFCGDVRIIWQTLLVTIRGIR